jgi:hypothetical protein
MYSQNMMNRQIAVDCTYCSFADVVVAERWRRPVEADGDEDGGRLHRPTWMEDDP